MDSCYQSFQQVSKVIVFISTSKLSFLKIFTYSISLRPVQANYENTWFYKKNHVENECSSIFHQRSLSKNIFIKKPTKYFKWNIFNVVFVFISCIFKTSFFKKMNPYESKLMTQHSVNVFLLHTKIPIDFWNYGTSSDFGHLSYFSEWY